MSRAKTFQTHADAAAFLEDRDAVLRRDKSSQRQHVYRDGSGHWWMLEATRDGFVVTYWGNECPKCVL